jgi:hypothetical protein
MVEAHAVTDTPRAFVAASHSVTGVLGAVEPKQGDRAAVARQLRQNDFRSCEATSMRTLLIYGRRTTSTDGCGWRIRLLRQQSP